MGIRGFRVQDDLWALDLGFFFGSGCGSWGV